MRARLTLLLAVYGLGCSVTASLGGDEAVAGTSSTGSDATTDATHEASTAASAGGSGEGTTEAGSSTTGFSTSDASSSTGTFSDTSGDGSVSGGDLLCEGPVDNSCLSCLRQSCCEALESCFDNPLCSCVLGCLEFAPDFISCLDHPVCGGGPLVLDLQLCAVSDCTSSCGF